MNGILNVLKPAGMTSFDVVGCLRKITGQKKIGHTGTLDPSAVGVLPICIGNATKAIDFMIDKDKVYRAELTLGIATDTQDSSGKVLFSNNIVEDDNKILNAVNSFAGEIKQVPPMYSAIKVGGKKLYELARKGETVERQARSINIFGIDIIKIWQENTVFADEGCKTEYKTKKVLFDVHCSKGTYIRTLCNDIGEKLGCGGHMSFLIRTSAGKYNLDTALTFEQISELSKQNRLEDALLPVETVFSEYGSISLDKAEMFKFNNGAAVKVVRRGFECGMKRVYDINGVFVGIGELNTSGEFTYLKSKKFFRDS